jgi:hypothetical protein
VQKDSTSRARVGWWRRHPRWTIAAVFGATALCTLLAKVAVDWPAFPDPVPWEVQRVATDRPDLVGKAYVYNCWGNFIDSQHLWRIEVNSEVIPALVRECDLRELDSAEEVPGAFWRQMPYWWRPPQSGPARYFISPGFRVDSRGQDGSHYLMVYDEASGVLYVWHKNNF